MPPLLAAKGDVVTTTIRLRVDFNSAAIRPTFDSRSIALRPLNDLRYGRTTVESKSNRSCNHRRSSSSSSSTIYSVRCTDSSARYRTGLSVTAVASRHNSRYTQSLRVMAALRLRVIVLDRRPADDGPTHTAAPVCLSVSPSSSVLRRLAGRGCY